MKYTNVGVLNYCFGCGVCSISCPKKIIELKLNDRGFYTPNITNPDLCVECGLCTDNCSFLSKELASQSTDIKSWGAWSSDNLVRRKASSGGVGFEIASLLIEKGYKVCGVEYNIDNQRPEHYIATNKIELIRSIGSKYLQSYTVNGLSQINKTDKYLVTGTPCQIDSFRRYIKKLKIEDNFVLMDFFCHSVPSYLAWKHYIKLVEEKVGKITYASWRNKFTGWHDSWAISMDGVNTNEPVNWHDSYNLLIKEKKGFYNSRLSQGDIFYNLFLGDFCCGRQCVKNCKFKYDKSSADIRIGDAWGRTYEKDDVGVSTLISFTEKGKLIVNSLRENKRCILEELPFEQIAEGQMKKNAGEASLSWLAWMMLKSEYSFSEASWKFLVRVNSIVGKIVKRLNVIRF
jgi:coenzyme F420-reducing hydrogenase beta subunit